MKKVFIGGFIVIVAVLCYAHSVKVLKQAYCPNLETLSVFRAHCLEGYYTGGEYKVSVIEKIGDLYVIADETDTLYCELPPADGQSLRAGQEYTLFLTKNSPEVIKKTGVQAVAKRMV